MSTDRELFSTINRILAAIEAEQGKSKDVRRLLEEALAFAKENEMTLEEEMLHLALAREARAQESSPS